MTYSKADVKRRQDSCEECASCAFVVECLKKEIAPPPEHMRVQGRGSRTAGAAHEA